MSKEDNLYFPDLLDGVAYHFGLTTTETEEMHDYWKPVEGRVTQDEIEEDSPLDIANI